MTFKIIVCSSLMCLLAAGCGPPDVDPGPPALGQEWKPLEALQSTDGIMGIAYNVEQGNVAAAKQHAKSEAFAKVLDEFANSELPPGYSDRQAEKDMAVEQLRAVVDAAKRNAPNSEVETLWKTAHETLKELGKPAGVE